MNDLIMMFFQFIIGGILFFLGYYVNYAPNFMVPMLVLGFVFNLLIYNSYGDFREEREEEEIKEEIFIQLKGGKDNENI